MKKTNHVQTAINALKKQKEKFRDERSKAMRQMAESEKSANFFLSEMEKLDAQIKSLEGAVMVEA